MESRILNALGIDPAFIFIFMLVLFIILFILYVNVTVKYNRLKNSYQTFMRGKDGKSLGIYIDSKKVKHIVYNTCPHLGCSLICNNQEKTWDCTCHSSRFSVDGECIKGPSTKDIKYEL